MAYLGAARFTCCEIAVSFIWEIFSVTHQSTLHLSNWKWYFTVQHFGRQGGGGEKDVTSAFCNSLEHFIKRRETFENPATGNLEFRCKFPSVMVISIIKKTNITSSTGWCNKIKQQLNISLKMRISFAR